MEKLNLEAMSAAYLNIVQNEYNATLEKLRQLEKHIAECKAILAEKKTPVSKKKVNKEESN